MQRLTHRLPAEQHGLDGDQLGIASEIDIERTGQAPTIEQDRLLRQPGKQGSGRKPQAVRDDGIRPRLAIDALAGLSGYASRGSGGQFHLRAEAVAAGQPARRVDEDRLRRVVAQRTREAQLGAALLEKPVEMGPAVARLEENARLPIGVLDARRCESLEIGYRQHRQGCFPSGSARRLKAHQT